MRPQEKEASIDLDQQEPDSRPHSLPGQTPPARCAQIETLRRQRMTAALPASVDAVSICGYVSVGSWVCENAETFERDRRSYSSKADSALKLASAFLDDQLKNVILVVFRSFAFLHSQGGPIPLKEAAVAAQRYR